MPNGLSNFRPPKDPKGKPVGKKPRNIGCLGCLGIFVLAFVGCTVAASINAAQPQDYNTAYEAERQCEERVKEKLKAPSTAEFSGTNATGGGPWTVTGQVDSQNSFGAMIRNEFGCTVTITGERATVRVEYIGE